MTLKDECHARLARLRERLSSAGLDGALFVAATDVYYFAGTRQNAALWVPASGEAQLLVRKSVERAVAESAVSSVRPFPPSKDLAGVFGSIRRIGFTYDIAPASLFHYWSRVLPNVELVDVSATLLAMRSVKSPWEQERMQATAMMLCNVFRQVPDFLVEGMREIDFAAEIEYRLRKSGNEGSPRVRGFNQEFFMGLALGGGSSASTSYFDGPVTGRGLSPSSPVGPSLDPILRDEPVLFDYTAMKEGYGTDMSRMAVIGTLPARVEEAFGVAREIQEAIVRELRPGSMPSELYARACAMAEQAGLGNFFMGPPGAQARFVGHGVGLELDEWPVLSPGFREPLIAGQVVALEPKFVLPEHGAVGIENTWVVGPEGGRRLTVMSDEMVRL